MDSLEWLNAEQTDLVEIGYVIGFFNADGGYSIAASGAHSATITQKLKDPLIETQRILLKWGINSTIRERSNKSSQLKTEGIQYSLRLGLNETEKFVHLVDGWLYGQKAKDHAIVKKLVALRRSWLDSNDEKDPWYTCWVANNKSEIYTIVKEWKESRKAYHST